MIEYTLAELKDLIEHLENYPKREGWYFVYADALNTYCMGGLVGDKEKELKEFFPEFYYTLFEKRFEDLPLYVNEPYSEVVVWRLKLGK